MSTFKLKAPKHGWKPATVFTPEPRTWTRPKHPSTTARALPLFPPLPGFTKRNMSSGPYLTVYQTNGSPSSITIFYLTPLLLPTAAIASAPKRRLPCSDCCGRLLPPLLPWLAASTSTTPTPTTDDKAPDGLDRTRANPPTAVPMLWFSVSGFRVRCFGMEHVLAQHCFQGLINVSQPFHNLGRRGLTVSTWSV